MDCFPWKNEQPQLHLDYLGGLISIKVGSVSQSPAGVGGGVRPSGAAVPGSAARTVAFTACLDANQRPSQIGVVFLPTFHSQRRKRPAILGGEQGGRQGGHGGTASDGNFDETLVESVDTGRRQ